jgi:hypothetical protein
MRIDTIALAGTIQKLTDRSHVKELQQAPISLVGAGHLYDELRFPNTHECEVGKATEVNHPGFDRGTPS